MFCIWIVNIITITTTFTRFNTKKVKYGIITVNINNLRSCFTFLIFLLKYNSIELHSLELHL